jgi:hypothetical protein
MIGEKSYKVPTCFCLRCGHTFDRASNMSGKGRPRDGDLTICIECGVLLRFNPDLTVSLTDETTADLTKGQRDKIAVARRAISMLGFPKRETKH